MKWIKHGDIQPSLKGSDHCPIYVDLHDEITLETGEILKLLDCMQQRPKRDPPRIAAQHWEEFSGKQTLLSNFFGKGKTKETSSPTSASSAFDCGSSQPEPPILKSKVQAKSTTPLNKPTTVTKKRKSSPTPSGSKKKAKGGQPNIASFFVKAATSTPKPTQHDNVIHVPSDTEEDSAPVLSQEQLDADYRLALELSEEATAEPSSSQNSNSSKSAWSSLFTPIPAPKCTIHGEPTKKYIANKPGPNKGRAFYLCSR